MLNDGADDRSGSDDRLAGARRARRDRGRNAGRRRVPDRSRWRHPGHPLGSRRIRSWSTSRGLSRPTRTRRWRRRGKPSIGAVAADARPGARGDPAGVRPPGRSAPGRDRAVDQPGDGQADPHRVRDRTPGADPLPAVLRRACRQGVGGHPAHHRGRACPGHPRAGRGGRRGCAVELPVDARRLEVRAGAGRRLHRGAQDRRAVTAVDAAGGRTGGAGRSAGGGVQRAQRGRGDGRSPTRRAS